jgi:peroxiredoxin
VSEEYNDNMKRRYLTPLLAVGVAILVGCSAQAQKGDKDAGPSAEIGKPAPNFTLTDPDGESHSLADYKGSYVVLEWVNFDCPFVHKHYSSGNMQTLQAAYKLKGVKWLSICSSAPGKQGFFEGDSLKSRIFQEHSQAAAYLIDSSGTVGKMYGAKTTPHMFIVNPEGTLIYAGGIDDKPTTKLEDAKLATNYVRKTLNAAMKGEEVEVKSAPPYGCSVKY